MKELLEEKGVTYREIQEKLNHKKEKNGFFENHKKISDTLGINRTALMTISLYEQAIIKTGRTPRIFHMDHGVEYANYLFKNYLSEHGVIQSMSLKGSPLSNRPSEYWFAQIQREKLDLNVEKKSWHPERSVILYDY